jgi:Ala-tRNA(Pro) deacylase
MSIAATQERYLVRRAAHYDLMLHPHTGSSHETSEAAEIPADQIAKAVVVRDAVGYALVVIPASHRLRLNHLRKELNRSLNLATEEEIARLFVDCEPGAVPPLGPAYGLETLLDEALTGLSDVYFEAGDHEQLVHLSGEDFRNLLAGARRGWFGREADSPRRVN